MEYYALPYTESYTAFYDSGYLEINFVDNKIYTHNLESIKDFVENVRIISIKFNLC